MRYLRMLTNSALGAALGAAYLTVLLLQLNPQVPLSSPSVWRWFVRMLLYYGVNLTVLFYAFLVLRELLSTRPLGPGWISVRVLAWMAAVTAGAASWLMWTNLGGFGAVLEAEAARRMLLGTAATTASAVVLTGIALVRYSFGQRGSAVSAALLALTVAGSLALPIAARGFGVASPLAARALSAPFVGPEVTGAPRVTLILLDGASLDYLYARVTDGRFPNFGRILDTGAAIDLATLRPTQAEPVWTAVATGKYPFQNGVRSAATYRVREGGAPVDLLPDGCYAHGLVEFGFVQSESHTSADWRSRPVWDIIGGYGLRVGVVRWPVTYPATQPVRGFLVTDRFHLVADSPIPPYAEQATYPPELLPMARAVYARGARPDTREILPANAPVVPVVDEPPGSRPERWDHMYGQLAEEAQQRYDASFLAVRYQGLDTTGHAYLRYAEPRAFGDVSEAERTEFGQVLDRYYAFIDGQVGRAIGSLGPDDLLLVVSGFGMQPVSPGKRLLARVLGAPDLSGTHEEAPDGFLLGYGAHVVKGKLPRGSVVDIAPTVLYYLGLPVGRDMDGFARTDLLSRGYTANHPITYIPTHQH